MGMASCRTFVISAGVRVRAHRWWKKRGLRCTRGGRIASSRAAFRDLAWSQASSIFGRVAQVLKLLRVGYYLAKEKREAEREGREGDGA